MASLSRTSFVPLLKKYLAIVDPAKVLEWGPGDSTEVILENSRAMVFSREHDQRWFDKSKARFEGYDRWSIVLESITRVNSYYAYRAVFDAPYDLIFIDGRRRVECCMIGLDMISPGGVLILHDAQRPHYSVIRKYINIIDQEQNGQTIVFKGREC